MSNKKNTNWKSLINFCAFIAIAMIGLALLISNIIKPGEFTRALTLVANIIAYTIVAISGFYYARSRRNYVYFIIWVISIVLIILSYVI